MSQPLTPSNCDLRDYPRMMLDSRGKRSARMADARSKGTHTNEEWLYLRKFCGNQCVRCGAKREDGYVERDHILPIYKGGSDAIENIQPVCARCNCSKGPEEIDHRPAGWREYVTRRLAE